jgi:hypothetical protein
MTDSIISRKLSGIPARWGHIRGHRVTRLLVYCGAINCNHSATLDADWLADDAILLELDRRMVCTACGHRGATSGRIGPSAGIGRAPAAHTLVDSTLGARHPILRGVLSDRERVPPCVAVRSRSPQRRPCTSGALAASRARRPSSLALWKPSPRSRSSGFQSAIRGNSGDWWLSGSCRHRGERGRGVKCRPNGNSSSYSKRIGRSLLHFTALFGRKIKRIHRMKRSGALRS